MSHRPPTAKSMAPVPNTSRGQACRWARGGRAGVGTVGWGGAGTAVFVMLGTLGRCVLDLDREARVVPAYGDPHADRTGVLDHVGQRLPAPAPEPATLTEREIQVLVLVARGLSNARIATDLGLSDATVKSRVNRILTRLGLENRVQAALFAHRAGLVTDPGGGPGPAVD